MDKLKSSKRVLKASVTRLRDGLENEKFGLDYAEIDLSEAKVSDLETRVTELFDKILDSCKEEEFDAYLAESFELKETIDKYKLILLRARNKLDSAAVISNRSISDGVNNTQGDKINVKLPEFQIPNFNGTSILEWLSFSDLFNASVGKNTKISNSQKLQYLVAALRGDALRVIQSLPIVDANFEIAWDLLNERYSNRRELIFSLIKRVLSIPQLVSESPQQILNMVDTTKEVVRLLKSLNVEVEGFADSMFTYIICQRLDASTRSWWERSLKDDEIPPLTEFLSFLAHHSRTLQQPKVSYNKKPTQKVSTFTTQVKGLCIWCKQEHSIYSCQEFKNLNPNKRLEFVRANKLCYNCLGAHRVMVCKSKYKCRSCGKKHNSLLHIDQNKTNTNKALSPVAKEFVPTNQGTSEQPKEIVTNLSSYLSGSSTPTHVLLCTAIIRVLDVNNQFQQVRALLDPGSQASFVSEACCARLGLAKKRAKVQITCLGSNDAHTNGITSITFTPHFKAQPVFSTEVFVLNKIIGELPHCDLPSTLTEPFADLTLADPSFFKSGPIDVLLGVNISLPLLRGKLLQYGDKNPFAVKSDLGWIISGNVNFQSNKAASIQVNNIRIDTDTLVKSFWELDSVPTASRLTDDEKACEDHFTNNCKRLSNGRYMVRLPCHTSPTKLGDSRQLALRRYKSLERTFALKPDVHCRYKEFINEYLTLQHMEKVVSDENNSNPTYYLPHHAVFKESSTTTKIRVVFDASAKSSSGLSLNDLLYTGPRVQQELFNILLRFRTFPVAISADAEKMFRQILVHPADADLQRILWRNDPNKPVETFRLLTVSYGTSASTFLSTRVMKQLAIDEKEDFPLASEVCLRDFYVDDLLSGASTEEEARVLTSQLNQMMEKGGFKLRKWTSNVPSVLHCIPIESQATNHVLSLNSDKSIKVLGIMWDPSTDMFNFSIMPHKHSVITKRSILSEIASVFDPLGWLAPTVIYAKVFLQELWSHKLDWDDPVPETILSKWTHFHVQLPLLKKLTIPRFVLSNQPSDIQLHAFCDASEKAYCAVIYMRTVSDNNIHVSLLTSKTRVAPVKTISLPRLELCSALLLTTLLEAVLPSLNIKISKIFAWSDSKVTLAWISSEPRRWLPFVANRVAKIQEAVSDVDWNHVPGVDNPADCATRGLLPSEFLECELWTQGPKFLQLPSGQLIVEESPSTFEFSECHLKEQKKIIVTTVTQFQLEPVILKFSSFTKLCRVISWCQRFISNSSKSSHERTKGPLTTTELSSAIIRIVKLVQQVEFGEELRLLKAGKPLNASSKIISLCPFLDSDEVIRVGGRLRNATIPHESKHQMILPRSHHITNLIIHQFHVTHLHAGPQLLLSVIRQKFWIPCGRDVVRKFVKKCITCFRLSASTMSQLMGDLPTSRVTPSRVFSFSGVDYAGPFLAKERNGRGKRSFKIYIAIFVCFSTHAIHLEVVSDLTTDAFLGSLKRFISRRGKPIEIVSDNATNFVGADRELRNTISALHSPTGDTNVFNFTASEGIRWKFNPPASPHHGGLWEAGVKSLKFHLRRTMGSSLLTLEELFTLTSQIEACLNSRPLCPLTADPNDMSPLTPGHFLIGSALTALPEPDMSQIPMSRLGRWQLVQRLMQHFWSRWSKEFLSRLQQRPKWQTTKPNITIGELVLIKNELMPPLKWKLARVLHIHPGKDENVRVVTLKTDSGELTRSINKLCRLPLE